MSAENQARARYLLKELTEGKSVEHKSWTELQTPENQALLVRALIALRNNADGGALLIGVDDKTRTLLPPPSGQDVKSAFKEDVVQTLLARYVTPTFEVFVEFVEIGPNTYPVIFVPRGMTAPVMCKRDLQGAGGRTVLKQKAIYVRTVRHGNVSTSEADGEDLKELIETCIANREVDRARFFTKLFAGFQANELRAAVAGLQDLATQASRMVGNTETFRNESLQRFGRVAQGVSFSGLGGSASVTQLY
jgi:hypothetical protein